MIACARRGIEEGQSLLEFALVMPLMVLIFMGIMDLGQGIYAYNVISNAAREGARYGVVRPNDGAGITSYAKANTAALDKTQITVNSQCTVNPDILPPMPSSCDTGNYMVVTVTYTFNPITAFFSPFTIRASTHMTIE